MIKSAAVRASWHSSAFLSCHALRPYLCPADSIEFYSILRTCRPYCNCEFVYPFPVHHFPGFFHELFSFGQLWRYCIEENHSRLADPAQRQLALYLSHHRRYSHYLSGTLAFQLFPSASRSRHGEKAGEDTSAEAHLQHCFFPLCSGCRRIPFQRYRHAQLVCQLRGHLISYEYCQGLLCLFSVFYFFCTGKRVPRPVHQTSWRIQDCFSSVVRSLFLVFAWPSLAANRPIPHCSLRFLSFCNIPYHTC